MTDLTNNPTENTENTTPDPDLAPRKITSLSDVWDVVMMQLAKDYSTVMVDTWLRGVRVLALEKDLVKLEVPSDFQRDVLSGNYSTAIAAHFENLLAFPISLELISKEERERDMAVANSLVEELDQAIPAPSQGDYMFENFIVGSSNRFAHAACMSVTNATGDSFNPLFVYGGSGLGKTHLLYAIRNALMRKNPGFKILYIKGDEFTNEMVESLGRGQSAMKAFREKYRFLDVLLIDDIQFIGGKESTQEEFFHTFNTLYEAKKQIVLTSDRPPKEIKTLEDRLRTRFEWGLMADVQPPDLETRIAILNRKAADLGVQLTNEVADFIAVRLKKNIRQLEGAVKKLKALMILDNQEINLDSAQIAIRDVLSENIALPQLIDRVMNEVGFYFSVPVDDIKGSKRNADFMRARHVSMYVLRETTNMSLKQIGEIYGGKDHTTVMHAIKKIENEIEENSDLRNDVNEIITTIRDG